MKHALTRILIACGLSVAAAAATQAQAAPADAVSPVEIVLPTETVGSMQPTPEAPAAARKEAYAALAVARTACRKGSDAGARHDCLAAAQRDFRDTLARGGIGS